MFSRKRPWQTVYLIFGVGLLGVVLWRSDLTTLGEQLSGFGLTAFALILLLYAIEFLADVIAWQVILSKSRAGVGWLVRLYAVRLVGEAFNAITPLAGMGGEPLKAVILKDRFAVPYQESGPSLLVLKTITLLSLLGFLAVGFGLILNDSRFSEGYRLTAGVGLGTFVAGVTAFFLVQRFTLTSRLARRVGQWRIGTALQAAMHHIDAFDQQLVGFYRDAKVRFAAAAGLTFVNWLVGALGTMVTMRYLGWRIDFADSWIIESFAQLVRAGTFFIPASIGAQEGAMVLVCAIVTGDATVGLAAALVRRARELIWIVAGILLGGRYT